MSSTQQTTEKTSKFVAAKNKYYSLRYGKYMNDLKLVLVLGNHSARAATSHYLQNILKTRDEKAALIESVQNIGDLYKQLFRAWKEGSDYVIISEHSDILHSLAQSNLRFISATLAESNSSEAVITPQTTIEASQIARLAPSHVIINSDLAKNDQLPKDLETIHVANYGHGRNSNLRINRHKLYRLAVEANFTHNIENFDVATYLTGEDCVFYMAATALTALTLGFDAEVIVDGIADYEPDATSSDKSDAANTDSNSESTNA